MKKTLPVFCLLMLALGLTPTLLSAQALAPGQTGTKSATDIEMGTMDADIILAATTADPASLPKCNSMFQFKRNNGNGWGVCDNQAQITVSTNLETSFPDLVQIHDGRKNYLEHKLKTSQSQRGNVIYCLPENNIPPALKVSLVFATNFGGCKTDLDVTGR